MNSIIIFSLFLSLCLITIILFFVIKRKNKNHRGIEYYRNITAEEKKNYDDKLANALENTTLTFSNEENSVNYKNDCSKYYSSVMHGAELLEKEGFRFPDMRGI